MLNLLINDEAMQADSVELLAVLEQYGAEPPFVIALNGEFVSREAYSGVKLQNGDKLEVLSPIFGG